MNRLVPFVLVVALAACGQPALPTTGRLEDLGVVTSSSIGADFVVSVRLPPSYDGAPDRRYPVVFQLDPTFLGELATTTGEASRLEAEGVIPEVIVVGVGRAEGEGDPAVRKLDFAPPPLDPASRSTGRADRFFAFLEDELVPRIDLAYRTEPTERVLIGHSLGGLFALYAFFHVEDGAAPLFTHVIAADPSYGEDRGVIFGYEQALAGGVARRPGSLFLTVALESGAGQLVYVETMASRVASRGYGGLRLERVVLDTDHGGAIAPSAAQGLAFALGGGR